ncbi:L-aspartate oxidase [Williamsia sp. CHRR-6]|uniref:L-aspartate oxidase n=1 Tax=Williamsia sp. CHRR-6 TaxID=2835871 RepID=UPI002024C639|nr:L-aspartate oxidase [Williamsia sp. CHRR-6]
MVSTARTPSDLIVVGAGVAGLTAAITAAELGLSVTVLAKGPGTHAGPDTATAYAQGGIAVVDPRDPLDSIEAHVADTVAAGAGHTDEAVARSIIAAGPDAVNALIAWGARFDTDATGRLRRTREGGHSARRIIHAGGDATGAEVQRALWTHAGAMPGITVIACLATELIRRDGTVIGVTAESGDGPMRFLAPTVVLATGGIGQVYAATTNPVGSTGDGIALALQVGASVRDMEFIQFHPTMLYTPGARGRRTLVSEAVRGEGATLVDARGDSIMAGRHPLGDLAPRDVVAQAIHSSMAVSGDPCVYLDARGVADFAERFPTVTAGVRAIGVDPVAELIPVVPGAHYLCGGVATDTHGSTDIDGLFAAGEVARTGLHGANRLASNSLLEALVVGRRVAARAADRVGTIAIIDPGADEPAVRPVLDRTTLQDAMSAHAGVSRDAEGLNILTELLVTAPKRLAHNDIDHEGASLAAVAGAVVAAATARTESMGCHQRTDDRSHLAHTVTVAGCRR